MTLNKGCFVKKLLLFSFPIVMLMFGFERESEAQSSTQVTPIATGTREAKSSFLDSVQPGATSPSDADLRSASAKAIKLIQHSQVVWYKKEVCTSCHHQLLTEIPLKLARERGSCSRRSGCSRDHGDSFRLPERLRCHCSGL